MIYCVDPSWLGDLYDYGHGRPAAASAQARIDGPWLLLKLPRSARVRLTLRLDLRTRPPSYRAPYDAASAGDAPYGGTSAAPADRREAP
jgi:hypothetical protein